jgi:hypothetical protein
MLLCPESGSKNYAVGRKRGESSDAYLGNMSQVYFLIIS